MLKNLASALILTERDAEDDDNAPKVKGRIITTVHKAKEVRPLVEKCITIARRALPHQDAADKLASDAERHTEQWRAWRRSPEWNEWNQAIAPVVAARRRTLKLLGDKEAVKILFAELAPRFADRPGGYTRVLELATPRLGDAGRRAILEFVGTNDRVKKKAQKPAIDPDVDDQEPETEEPADQIEDQVEDQVEEAEGQVEDQAEADEEAPKDNA